MQKIDKMTEDTHAWFERKKLSKLFLLFFGFLICLLVVFFESIQQFFYINHYKINETVTFSDLFFLQLRKWIVWVAFLYPLWVVIAKTFYRNYSQKFLIFIYLISIVITLNLVLLSMSIIEPKLVGTPLTYEVIIESYYKFYFYQKTPIYLFGYVLICLLFRLYHEYHYLEVKVVKLNELNAKELKSYIDDKSDQNQKVIKVRVGYSNKIIKANDVEWIGADDYCVNIYTRDVKNPYSMRISLKALQDMLPDNFLRVHRSSLVNLDYISEYSSKDQKTVKTKNGYEIPVAKNKYKYIKDYFENKNL